ncbi:MAG: DUF1538 domain-containing protein [Euryarchaeota archaeon]|nr:DUF1538 domain-containing protein [Euryarchaeota archaeon]
MREIFKDALKEVVQSVLPISLVVLLIQLFLIGSPADKIATFLLSVVMVALGFSFFLMGAKVGMLPMGEAIGGELAKRGSIIFLVVVTFMITFLATVAEPDVRVLTGTITSVSGDLISRSALIISIAFGAGIFVVLSMLRIVYNVPIQYLYAASYFLVIVLSFFTPSDYLAISLDAGGVTTGPMNVPIILALGSGVASVMAGRSALSDGFGLIGFASIGPILGVMLLGVFLS